MCDNLTPNLIQYTYLVSTKNSPTWRQPLLSPNYCYMVLCDIPLSSDIKDQVIYLPILKILCSAWNEGLAKRVCGDPVALLTDCGDILYTWNWSKFRHVQRELKQKTAQLEKLQIDQHTRDTSADESKLQGEIKELLIREEILWRQHGRVQWLKEGDINTRFFHFNASNRRRRNKISRLRDESEN
ncbi:hypothetical protein Tco_0672952 [Tanacetum coccineum]